MFLICCQGFLQQDTHRAKAFAHPLPTVCRHFLPSLAPACPLPQSHRMNVPCVLDLTSVTPP